MYVGMDFLPADQRSNKVYGFDFGNDLDPGENISVAETWTMTVAAASIAMDANPMTRVFGPPGIWAAEDTGLPTVATQRIGNLLPGVTYMVRAEILTDKGNTKSLHSHILGIAPV